MVANSAYYGSGMKIAPAAAVADGVLDVVVIEAASKLALMRSLPKVYDGGHVDLPEVTLLTGKRVELRADSARPVPVGGDGEPLGQLPALADEPAVVEVQPGRAGGHRLSRARARADRFGQTAQVETRTGAAPTWRESFDSLVTSEPRSVEEWSRLAALAYLTRPEGWDDWSARAVEACLDAGAGPTAARCAFWLGFGLLDEGRAGRGAGWLARADELLGDVDCAERGLLLTPVALGLLESGDAATALERFIEIVELGERHDDADVATIGRLGRGQALVELGDRDSGVALLDRAMVAVQSDALSPQAAGLVTCGAIVTCQRLLEVTRAQEWVFELSTWCDAHSDLVPYRGQCLVHRAEVLRMRGSWPEATAAAEARAPGSTARRRSATRGTSAASCTGSAASTRTPRRPTGAHPWRAATRSPASRSCGWSRVTSQRPRGRSGGWPTRPAGRSSGPARSRRTSRSRWRRASWPTRAPAPTS